MLVAAAPGVAARLLGLSSVHGGLVAASLVVAGVATALAACGVLELTGLAPTAALWPGLPAGLRGEVAAATILGAVAGACMNARSRLNR